MAIIEHLMVYDGPTQFDEHFHTSCELMYIHKGHLMLDHSGNSFELKSGMLYLIPSCVRHSNHLINTNEYTRTLLFFNPWEYGRVHFSVPLNNFLMGFTHKEPVVVQDDFGAAELFERAKNEMQPGELMQEDSQTAIITLLIAGILRSANISLSLSDEPDSIIVKVQQYIRKHSSEQLVISDIAERFYINKYYLTHKFKEQTGMSPRQFLNYTRLSDTYNLLHDSSLRISDIAQSCGFASASDMTKRFRKEYGMTPQEFRREISTKKQE